MIKAIIQKISYIRETLKRDDEVGDEMEKNVVAALALLFIIVGVICLFTYLNYILAPFIEKPYVKDAPAAGSHNIKK